MAIVLAAALAGGAVVWVGALVSTVGATPTRSGIIPALTGGGAGAPGPRLSVSTAEGVLDEAVPLTSTGLPAIARLDPDLYDALVQAGIVAASDGIVLEVTSGWRSRAYQQRLFDEAVARYGSLEEARRWVASPDTSSHVTGDAVDIGPVDAQYWLISYGAQWGLCQIYANETWHFERATTPGGTCPALRADAAG